MSETCKTVKIVSEVTPGGHIVINESDLLPEHVLFVEEASTPEGGQDDVGAPEGKSPAKKAK